MEQHDNGVTEDSLYIKMFKETLKQRTDSVMKEVTANRLNRFLEAVKTKFPPETAIFHSDIHGREIINRLNRFMDIVKTHFSAQESSS